MRCLCVGITRTRMCPGQVHDGVWERDLTDRIAAGTIKTDKTPQELVRLYCRRIE
jgi:hypothetical protein